MRRKEQIPEKRSKTLVFSIRSDQWKREVELILKERQEKRTQQTGRGNLEVTYKRTEQSPLSTSRKEVELTRISHGRINGQHFGESRRDRMEMKKRIKEKRERLVQTFSTQLKKMKGGSRLDQGEKEVRSEWKEQVARVGTGYRVRRDEKDPRKRNFDVGYADLKTYKRKEGREVKVEGTNMGRMVSAKGKDARVKVMNAVCAMEKRRPASEYTGSGILRKSRVGKLKLKPTKPSGKE